MGPWSPPPGPAAGPSPSCGRWAPRPWPWPWRSRCWRPSAFIIGPCCGCRGCCWAPRSPCPPCSRCAWAPHPRGGSLPAGAPPTWLLGSFAVLSLLYRAEVSADPALVAAEPNAEQAPTGAAVALSSTEAQQPGAEALTKRAQAERAYADLSADGAPVT